MRRRVAALLLGVGALLLLTPGAPGLPDVPGDPSPPLVTPVITGTLGAEGWYTSNLTVSWSIVDPESIILSTAGCDTRTLTADTLGTRLACTAVSDGGEATAAKTFKVDKTPPVASATPRSPGANGWYKQDVTVDFAGVDATSEFHSCSPAQQTYGGPDTVGTSLVATCRDRAGNTAAASFLVKYDETPPQASPAARPPDANGWYNHAVDVIFQGSDATSGVGSCSEVTYPGPDDPSVAVSGTCRDLAGNESPSRTFTFQYDETAPVASATPSRGADANGWYNHTLTITFSASDATSGFQSCDAPTTYSTPDNRSASVDGSCRDRAGNVARPSFGFKYDGTPPQVTATPSRQPNANEWYNAPLTVSFVGTDATAGVTSTSCSGPATYPGPDDDTASLTGTCVDEAGNLASTSFAFKYDATAPTASATPSRQPNANGWYKDPLTISFTAADGLSGPGPCTAPLTYSTPDTLGASLSGTCVDRAGNQSKPASFGFKYDATPPVATATADRPADANGWYNRPLTVGFAASDATSGFQSCDAPRTYSSPDSASASVGGSCLDRAGNAAPASVNVQYDATAPQVSGATPSRQPDSNGWFNQAVTVSFEGSDATSGLDGCTQASYSGPDAEAASVTGRCRDRAGNQSGLSAFPLNYDATGPQVTAVPGRAADANGWYNRPLSVDFAGSDATSGIASCSTPPSYSGPDTASTLVSGSCRDRAGNTTSSSFALSYDATKPQASAIPARAEDANGWYNRPLPVSFAGSDPTSGIESCAVQQTYEGPDTAAAAVGGSCRDRAGNTGLASLAFKYDDTGPQVTAAADRAADANGWYNHPLTVSFAGSDAISGVEACSAPQAYSGPDAGNTALSGSCRDRAGNTRAGSLALGYDSTAPLVTGAAPARPHDATGWFNHPVAITFQGGDVTSGVDTCTQVTYTGPDDPSASVSGSCRDRAGNASGSSVFALSYDGTAPQVTGAAAVRPPDQDGWYNRPVAFAFLGSDATAGIASCPPRTYEGPDSPAGAVAGTCVDQAGNRSSKSFPVRYDDTGPEVTPSVDREPDANGWYNRALRVSFSGSDPVSGLVSCALPQSYSGPDSGFAVVGGTCLDKAGNVGVASLPLRYDATAPQVTGATPARPPDSNGWYNHPLAVSFQGSDATSEIDTCTVGGYAGPDAHAASVSGSCLDRAGNGSAGSSFPLKYDSTPPALDGVRVKPGNRSAVLSWVASPDTNLVEIVRSAGSRGAKVTVYRGTGRSFTDRRLENGVRYHYALTGFDEARNAATRGVDARPAAPLHAPAAGARVSAPPRLSWAAVENATYYNVQVWRQGKIFSAWPTTSSIVLKRRWTYAGRRYHLNPGRYRWYVWPGYGRRAAKNYGNLLGSSSFVVTR